MKTYQWKLRRQLIALPDAHHCWDRVSQHLLHWTQRQAQAQTSEQQLERLQAHGQIQNWDWHEEDIFRADGYSGSLLKRPE